MTETAKKPIKVLVVGTDHNIQRHQDTDPELERVRVEFEKFLRKVIKERKIDLVAEEAGDDKETWEHLKKLEKGTPPELEVLFEGTKVVDHPVSTIAKQIVDEQPRKLRHVDIRAPNAEKLSITERDEAMAGKTKQVLEDADSILVIVGEDHRVAVAERLKSEGMDEECLHFP